MHERLSDTKEFFLDMLYLFGVFLSSGYSVPPRYACDRESYRRFMQEHERIEARKKLYELKKREYLNIKAEGNKVFFMLTEKGILEALKQEIMSTEKLLPDNYCCLVSFDIPENVKKTRNVFRNFLKKVGFKQVHLSVWKSKADVVKPLSELVRRMNIEKWVQVYKAKAVT